MWLKWFLISAITSVIVLNLIVSTKYSIRARCWRNEFSWDIVGCFKNNKSQVEIHKPMNECHCLWYYLPICLKLWHYWNFSDCRWKCLVSTDSQETQGTLDTRNQAPHDSWWWFCSPATSHWSTWTWWWRTPCHWRRGCQGSLHWCQHALDQPALVTPTSGSY